MNLFTTTLSRIGLFLFLIGKLWAVNDNTEVPYEVSFHEHVRPIFQAKCHGCHQPARSRADFVMTDVESLIAGGEGGEPVVVPGKPEESYLIDLVTLQDGDERPEMPERDEPLTPYELALVTNWIKDGAIDDTPENARQLYSRDNPPQYAVPPVITSLDYSPNGQLLAVAGFHEVLIHKADGSGLISRLIGLSERIESARFSPDGKFLAVAGGLPGRMGEIQIWDVAKERLILSRPVGYDTAYGASFSPDGKYVSFGMPDNTLRAIEIEEGDEVLFMGGHNDWVLDTAWSPSGDHLVSVSRDMSTKLTEVETERLIDNITSITPGALRGGVNAIDSHPVWDHVLVGGSDGVPQIYRMHRETKRKIGDNANLVRKYPAMKGRIWSAAFAPDGKSFAAVSSLNGKGQINYYASDYDATISPELKKLFETPRSNPDEEKNVEPEIEAFHTRGAILLNSIDTASPAFSVAFAPDGKTFAAGTSNGRIHLIDSESGEIRKTFVPVEVSDSAKLALAEPKKPDNPINLKKGKSLASADPLEDGRKVSSISIFPSSINLDRPDAYKQLLVTGVFETGETADLTRLVRWSLSRPVASISEERGVIRPNSQGRATLIASFLGLNATAKVQVTNMKIDYEPDFVVDVNPILTRLGCNAGTCHGAKDGKNGFKLSLRGYDMLSDVRAFSDDHASRRANFASPDHSLMLLKTTGAVPHEGGIVTDIGSDYYETIRKWIANGASMNLESKKVQRIELQPQNPVIQDIGDSQQIRVIAHYVDGRQRDVTLESFVESGNTEVAIHDDFGLLATLRRGEAPILARYEGAYAATTLTVMGDRGGFVWEEPETWNNIDKLVAAKWKRMKILSSPLTSDQSFIRRIHLDLTGLPPDPDRVLSFLADKAPAQKKREAVIDKLIGSPEFVEHWSNKWSDMLQVNSKFLGKEGAQLFRDWIRDQVSANKPYDEFVYSILTATGSNKENPAASYYKILRTPEELVENTTHLFLATRFNCNKCHDHPFEKWNVDNYYQTAAFFAQIGLERDKKNAGEENIGGSAVENPKPLFEIISDITEGSVTNIVTGQLTEPIFPYSATPKAIEWTNSDEPKPEPTRREQLAAWITAEDNQFFAKSYANRIWGYLTGTGIIEPIDDIRAGNPPTNPELLNYLTDRFVDSGFNVRELIREICNSRTYQLSIETNPFNEDDEINYSHGKARRLPAEVLYDAVHAVTGAVPNIPGAKLGMRAQELADVKLDTEAGFLANLGRPSRESACECDRTNDVQLGAVMSLLSGPAIAEAVGDRKNAIAQLVREEPDDDKLIENIYLRILNRMPTQAEIALVKNNWSFIEKDHDALLAELAEMESDWVYRKAALETKRFSEITSVQTEIADYTPEFEAKRKAAKAAKRDLIASTKATMWNYEWDELPAIQEKAMQMITVDRFWTDWSPLRPEKVKVSGNHQLKLTVAQDASVLANGKFPRGFAYTLTIHVKNQTITGFMLEVLTDDSLPGFGPGSREDGEFAITEFSGSYYAVEEPKDDDFIKLEFVDAVSDYTAEGFNVKNLINDDLARDDYAWSVMGQGRRPHWARMKLKEPLVVGEEGATLKIKIDCRYSDGDYPLAKFRVLATDSSNPLNQGLPARISSVFRKAPDDRSSEENAAVYTWFKYQESGYLDKRFEWVKAKRPIPKDEKMEDLKASLALAELSVEDDLALVQLRQDVTFSNQQDSNRRLTAAQDLAWALINNSSFIFNH